MSTQNKHSYKYTKLIIVPYKNMKKVFSAKKIEASYKSGTSLDNSLSFLTTVWSFVLHNMGSSVDQIQIFDYNSLRKHIIQKKKILKYNL